MRDIKAIETFYRGHKFRSRLEARWAVFFDTLGWEWVYEPEAISTEHGGYLVDFYLPGMKKYAEIKPHELSSVEFDKAVSAAVHFHAPVLALIDLPSWEHVYWEFGPAYGVEGDGPGFCVCKDSESCWDWPHVTAVWLNPEGAKDLHMQIGGEEPFEEESLVKSWDDCRRLWGSHGNTASINIHEIESVDRFKPGGDFKPRRSAEETEIMKRACSAARTARFDNGVLTYLGFDTTGGATWPTSNK